jgi:hypothetical protein
MLMKKRASQIADTPHEGDVRAGLRNMKRKRKRKVGRLTLDAS